MKQDTVQNQKDLEKHHEINQKRVEIRICSTRGKIQRNF